MVLKGKRALVTGAAGGIGRACAVALAQQGAAVFCADMKACDDTLAEFADSAPCGGQGLCDVADEASVADLMGRLHEWSPKLDVLVHCAGIIHEAPLLETATSDFDRVLAVNLRGTFLVGREAIRAMLPNGGGRVILTASDLAYTGRETFSPYVASKHGVLGLMRSWAREFAPHILVNALCPGPIDTDMLGAETMSAEWRERELDIPLRRFGQAGEVAEVAAFLAGPGARYITGQGLGVNGGSVMP